MSQYSDFSFLHASASTVAPQLLGCILERQLNDHKLLARIVETEAYDQSDAASHSYNGITERSKIMFEPPGYLYVYFTYGMHYCCNIVVGKLGQGSAVLIRAVEPIEGVESMVARRGGQIGTQLTNGPAKLCQALAIDRRLNGHDLHAKPLRLIPSKLKPDESIVQTTRVGIRKAVDTPWRFYIATSAYVSRP